jgi:hypothetical protein
MLSDTALEIEQSHIALMKVLYEYSEQFIRGKLNVPKTHSMMTST